jgi:hypothetical protein
MQTLTRRKWLKCCALSATIAGMWSSPVRAIGAPWVSQRAAGPFLCSANFELDRYAPLFDELIQLQAELVRTLGIEATREPVELYLFASKGSYQQHLKQVVPHAPYRRALFVKGTGHGAVYAHLNKEFAIDLRHECTHGLLHGVLPMVPLWLDEGLAEYFEAPASERAYGNPHLSTLKWNIRLGMVPRLKSLEARHDLSQMGRGEYRYSWAYVHFMLHGPRDAHEELALYLRDIQLRVPPGNLSDRLERRLPNLESRMINHFRSWKQ